MEEKPDPWAGLPKRLRIIGKHYKVRVVEKVDDDGNDGDCDQGTQTILVKQACGEHEYARDVMLHEAIHAVDHQMKADLTEEQVEKLGTGVLALLRENREFVRWLLLNEPKERT